MVKFTITPFTGAFFAESRKDVRGTVPSNAVIFGAEEPLEFLFCNGGAAYKMMEPHPALIKNLKAKGYEVLIMSDDQRTLTPAK